MHHEGETWCQIKCLRVEVQLDFAKDIEELILRKFAIGVNDVSHLVGSLFGDLKHSFRLVLGQLSSKIDHLVANS